MIVHCVAVQLRVVGTGNLDLRLLSLDEERIKTLSPIVMASSTSKLPVALANFSTPRMQLEIKTDEIDETFFIGSIILYTKPVATSYPQ